MKKHIEVNGPANILLFLSIMLDQGRILPADADRLAKEATKTLQYLQQLDNPNRIDWYNINGE